jgi:hypothetical protein
MNKPTNNHNIYLLDSIPNMPLPELGRSVTVSTISCDSALDILTSEGDLELASNVISCIGDTRYALAISNRLTLAYNASSFIESWSMLAVPVSRKTEASVSTGDILICALVTPEKELKDDELWSKEEMDRLPIKWVKVEI